MHMCYRVAICLLISGCSSVAANIENSQLRITFTNSSAMIFARQERDWIEVAAWNPLWRFITDKDALWTSQDPRIHQDGKLAIDFLQTASDPNGIEWNVRLRIALEKSRPVARIQYQIEPKQAAAIKGFSGPMIHVGQDTTGAAKTWGLFPGLEYLFGAEPSSNERDFAPNLANRSGPHPNKITVPLMAITIGPESQKLPEKPDRFLTPDSLMDRAAAKSLTTPF